MNDLMVIAFPTWAFWFLVAIGALNAIDLILKIVNHFLARRIEMANMPTKCWKCGDADPAFTDVCQVPACGMREQP